MPKFSQEEIEDSAAVLIMEKMTSLRQGKPIVSRSAASDFGSGLKRGIVQFPADVSAMRDLAGGRPPSENTEAIRRSRVDPMSKESSEFFNSPEEGFPLPDSFAGRFGERVGRSALFASLSAPVAAAAGGLPGVIAEVSADLFAINVGEAAAEAGAPDSAKFIVEMMAAMVVPGVAARKAAFRAPLRGQTIGKKAGKTFAEERRLGKFGFDPEGFELEAADVKRLANEYGMTEDVVRQTVATIRRRMGRDTRGSNVLNQGAIDEVVEGLRIFPDKTRRPPTAALLGDRAGQNLPSMQKTLSALDDEFSAELDGIKQVVEKDLREQLDRLTPNGGVDGVRRNSESARNLLEEEAKLAWTRANESSDQLPMISTKRLKLSTKEAVRRAAGFPGRTPDEVAIINALPDTITHDQFQAIRSNALLTGRVANRGDGVSQFKSNNLDPILDALNKELDSLPDNVGSAEYRRALALTKRNKRLFNDKTEGYSAVTEFGDMKRSVNRIKGAKDPEAAARHAIEVMSASPDGDGVQNLRAMFAEELFGSDISKSTPRTVLLEMKRRRPVYEAIFGKEALKEYENIAQKIRINERFSAGTPSAIKETGSGLPKMFAKAFGIVEWAKTPIQKTLNGVQTLLMRRDIRTNDDVHFLMREMLKDGDLFVRLMKVKMEEKSVAQWVVDWNVLTSRSKLSQRLTKGVGRNVAQGVQAEPQPQQQQAAPRQPRPPIQRGTQINQPLPPQGPQGQGIQ